MTQVSKKPLGKEIENKIYESFYRAIGLLGEQEAKFFINDLLTPTERVMLPKRLAIAILLYKRWGYDSIKSNLNVTQTTIASVLRTLEYSNGLKLAIEKLAKNAAWTNWWQGVENLFYRMSSPGKLFLDEEVVEKKLGHQKKTLI